LDFSIFHEIFFGNNSFSKKTYLFHTKKARSFVRFLGIAPRSLKFFPPNFFGTAFAFVIGAVARSCYFFNKKI
jgi:hypothetical protein